MSGTFRFITASLLVVAATFPNATAKAKGGPARGPGWGHIIGRVVFDGKPDDPALMPFREKLPVYELSSIADSLRAVKPRVVARVPNETLLIDEKTRGVKNAFVYLARKPHRVRRAAAAGEPLQPAQMVFREYRFSPRALVVEAGRAVRMSAEGETANFFSGWMADNQPFNRVVGAGQSISWTAEKPEKLPVPIKSTIHPTAKSWWLVTDHPYATVTGEDGSFHLENLPAGEHQLVIWHAAVGYVAKNLTVVVKHGETTPLPFQAITVERLRHATAEADRKPPLVAEQQGESRREQAGEEPGTSPASVFHAAQQAMVEEDFAALSDLMTSRLRDGFALTLVVQAGMLRMLAGEADLDKLTLPEETRFRRLFDKQKRIANRIAAVMERHGLAPPEKLKEIMNRNDPATADDPESAKKARQEAIAKYLQPIQDPRAFIAEIAPLLRTDYGPNPFETNRERKFTTPNLADTRLIDLKIEGDISTGTLAVSREDLPILRIDDRDLWGSEIKFERIGGGWKLAELDLGLVSPWGTPPSPEAAAEARPVDGRTDLSGEWLMTLPAGFEHRATLVAKGENRYRLDVPQAANVLEGLYELRDGMLAVMEPDDERMTDFVWKLHNANVLLLAEQRQPSPNGANYVDATLTRQVASPK